MTAFELPTVETATARAALEVARTYSSPSLFNHSVRAFIWASILAQQESITVDTELLYVAAMFHDLETGKELAMFAGHVGPVFAVAFGPDGTAFSGGEDRTIRRWQLDGAREVAMIAGASD